MTTRITHLNTNFRESKNLISPSSNDVTFVFTSEGLKCFLLQPGIIVPSLVQIQKGVMDFEKNIHSEFSKKCPFNNFIFHFRN